MKLGSLFDGSGGFPLAGSLCGIAPAWAAEVEPYPIAVTRSRFPGMKHLGDVSRVNGGAIESVDIITFGSPCQDLSVAGKRAGLKHEANGDEMTTRSGLFMEAVRIIREMREATNGLYPRFALWENVVGAFSSNGGDDFRVVLEELIKIVEPEAAVPPVPKKNGWALADSYVGSGWSLAYRVFDAQYWGVAQRRRRIHLVVDFRGQRARAVLFERDGVQGLSETLGANASAAGESADGAGGNSGDDAAVRGEDLTAWAMDPGFFTVGREVTPTMLANMGSFPHVIFQPGKPARRLMPVEAARLQGFPDHWGETDHKDAFSDEEYAFWSEVRATHARVNGKAARLLDRRAMVEWYNALHTESSELKMWGNGIALPPALYCMQGMAAELRAERGMT